MAASIQRAVSDGTLVNLPLSIDYFDRAEISVLIDAAPVPAEAGLWAWVGTTDAVIAFTPAIAAGVEVTLQRSTATDEPRHVFSLGAQFLADALDENFEQVLRVAQEAKEGGYLQEVFNDVDMHSYRLTNLGAAIDPSDAVPLGQYQADAAGAAAAATAAQAALNTILDQVLVASEIGITPIAGLGANVQSALAELATIKTTFAEPSGSSLLGFVSSIAGGVARTVYAWINHWAVVKNFVAGEGITDDTIKLTVAVAQAYTENKPLYWNGETCLTTDTIPNFHDVKHVGRGAVLRGSDTWTIGGTRITANKLYVSPTGDNTNDGLTASKPKGSIQTCVDLLHKNGPIVGRQQIIGAAGVYAEKVTVPDGLAMENNYLEFKFPAAPGVRGDPTAWPAGGAILDGTGLTGNGFETGRFNKLYVEYLLVRNWYDTGVAATAQVVRGINVSERTLLYCYGVSGIGNGFENIGVSPGGSAIFTGGILDGARYSADATAGRISFTASAAGVDNTTIRNALEYGLHVKHDASAVLDYTEFLDCGQAVAAAAYGAALFAYKSGASIDTRSCTFKRNNIVYNARGGFIATHTTLLDVIGTGADANARVWKVKGGGADDLIHTFNTNVARDISKGFSGGTTTGATALVYDTGTTIPAGYLTSTDQFAEFEIYATNGAGGTAQIRPSLVTPGGVRYELGNFQIAAGTNAHINLKVYASSGGAVATVLYSNIGATTGGTVTGQLIVNPIVFDVSDLEFQVWGDTTAANVLTVRKSRCILWG